MLYIASTLTPTPITHALRVPRLTGDAAPALVLAKPDRIEVWRVTAAGLEIAAEMRVWGTIIGLAAVDVPDAHPHLLVLTAPPTAALHLVTLEDGVLSITASETLRPATPQLRLQEYYTGIMASGAAVFVSLWVGVLTALEVVLEKVKDAKKRGVAAPERLVFKAGATSTVNIVEHNLLDLAPLGDGLLSFVWMNDRNGIMVQARARSSSAPHTFTAVAPSTDAINPLEYPVRQDEDVDFGALPFACPAAQRVLPIGSGPGGARMFLLAGDEYAVLYAVTPRPPSSPKAAAAAGGGVAKGGVGKKRRSSASGRSVPTDGESGLVRPVWRVRQGYGTVVAAAVIENHTSGGSVLLGDEAGRLTAVGWEFDGAETVRVGRIDLGQVSPPSALAYLDNGHAFIASAVGDSLLVNVDLAASPFSAGADDGQTAGKSKGKSRARDSTDAGAWNIVLEPEAQRDVTLRERWMNIAPVKDFVVVEEDDGRVSHLVVSSGAGNTNSLRIVRSGVGFDDALTIEGIVGVERMWSIPGSVPTLLLSFADSTALLHLEPAVAPVAAAEGVTRSPTLAAGLVGEVLVQVTPVGVHLWSDVVAGTALPGFSRGEIVAGAVKGECVAAAFRDGSIAVWKVASGLQSVQELKLDHEAAAVDVSEGLLAVADWLGGVTVYDSTGARMFSATESVHASSLLFGPTSQLLAGLADGTLVTYDLAGGRTQSSLGSRPLTLVDLANTNADASPDGDVFAAGISERLSLLFIARGHPEVSASGKKGVIAAAAVSTSTGASVALATAGSVTLVRVASLKKLQVQTLDLGPKSATRLTLVPELRLLACGTVTQTLARDTGDVLQLSGMELRDPATLELLAEYKLPAREAVTSVAGVTIRGKRYVAVGTAVFADDDEAHEARLDDTAAFLHTEKGRLLLFKPVLREGGDIEGDGPSWSLDLVAAKDKDLAPVLDIISIHQFLAIATPSKVWILLPTSNSGAVPGASAETSPDPAKLERTFVELDKCTFAFAAQFLAVSPGGAQGRDVLVVGDAMRSVLVLDVDPDSGAIAAHERCMDAHAVRSLAPVRDDGAGVVITDDNANVLTFRLKNGLEQAATFGLHEAVARMRPGALASTAPDVFRPDLLFATVSGRIGMLGELGLGAARTLGDLQRNMNGSVPGPGGLDWRSLRRSGTSTVPRETRGFIDGDYVREFTSLEEDTAATVLRGAGAGAGAHEAVHRPTGRGAASRGDVVRVLETIVGMH